MERKLANGNLTPHKSSSINTAFVVFAATFAALGGLLFGDDTAAISAAVTITLRGFATAMQIVFFARKTGGARCRP
jgi:hypothetical protein